MVQLYATDIIAVTIALTLSLALIVTTILRNIQLTHQRDYWRDTAKGWEREAYGIGSSTGYGE